MSSRSAARGREAARSIRLALRTSSIVAVSSASPSRCFLFWPGRRARIASPIVRATVAIPPTTPPHPLPIRRHAPRRRLERAAQETTGGEGAGPRSSGRRSSRRQQARHVGRGRARAARQGGDGERGGGVGVGGGLGQGVAGGEAGGERADEGVAGA